MTITTADLGLFKGELYLTEIQDNVVNNLFDDIDDIQLVTGGERIVECAFGVKSDNTEPFFIPRVCVLTPPSDAGQVVTLQQAKRGMSPATEYAGFAPATTAIHVDHRLERRQPTGSGLEAFTLIAPSGSGENDGYVNTSIAPGSILRIREGSGETSEESTLLADFQVVTATIQTGTHPPAEGGSAVTFNERYIVKARLLADYTDWAINFAPRDPVIIQVSPARSNANTDRMYGVSALDTNAAENATSIIVASNDPSIYRDDEFVLVHSTQEDTLPNPIVADTTYSLSRASLAHVEIVDAAGVFVGVSHYEVDLVAGEVVFPAPLDLAAFTQPLVARNRIEQYNRIVNTSGTEPCTLSLLRPLVRAFTTAEDTLVSSVYFPPNVSTLVATARVLWDQQNWEGVWYPEELPDEANANFNSAAHPIEPHNYGTVDQRWRIQITSGTSFELYGETLGLVGSGTTEEDFSPERLPGVPYFTIRAAGWGQGWTTDHNLVFETRAARSPIAVRRSVANNPATDVQSATLLIAGSINTA